MDISQEELPITAFFTRTGNKKKDNLPSAGKRKRNEVEVEADPKLAKRGKGKGTMSLKPVERLAPKKPMHLFGTSRASTSKGKQPLQKDIRASRPPSPEVLDLTTPSPDGKRDAVGMGRRRAGQNTLSGHTSASGMRFRVVDQSFPSPPLTDLSMKSLRKSPMLPATSTSDSCDQLNVATSHLPTPGTSVARPIVRPRSSHLSKVIFSRTPTSPLTSRQCVLDIQLLSNSSSPSDGHPPAYDGEITSDKSHADVAHALLKVAPKGYDRAVASSFAHEGNLNEITDDDPFAAPAAEILVPPSQPLHLQLPLPPLSHSFPIANAEALIKSSLKFAVPSLPNRVLQSHTTETTDPRRATDINLSSPRAVVESSQSQMLLPSADSPRRMEYPSHTLIASSQSQVLLPFVNSPRRMERLFSPGAENNEASQIVGSSQSQIEKELNLSTGVSQIGLFALPLAAENASTNVHDDVGYEADSIASLPESMLLESIPCTPPNQKASRWRSLHIGSSPLSSASAVPTPSYKDQSFFNDPMVEYDQVGDTTLRLEENIRSWGVSRASASRSTLPGHNHLDDSGSESESETAAAKSVGTLKQKKHRSLYPVPRGETRTDVGGILENSLLSERACQSSHCSPTHAHSYPASSQLLSEASQALYLAGAPLSASDYSLRTVATDDTTQSTPPAVRNFLDMFDDDGSYPKYFPMDLRC